MTSEAPKRIWAHPTERQPRVAHDKKNAPWVRGRWKDHDSGAHGDVEYVRADHLEALQAKLDAWEAWAEGKASAPPKTGKARAALEKGVDDVSS